jgi:hypothetical protein
MEMHRNESVGVDQCTPSAVWVGADEGEVMLLRGLLLGARDREALLGADSEAPHLPRPIYLPCKSTSSRKSVRDVPTTVDLLHSWPTVLKPISRGRGFGHRTERRARSW